ncbi:MAG: crnA, partial [Verrucomicrobia bacterium]|nr:crnA [Verrucomicrobiota bacterium]
MNPTHYANLRPRALVRRRLACPVAYVPIGILEWHGFHNPIGLDAIKAERACAYLAERLGGLVMPTLYWADNRAESVEVIC